MLWWMGASLEIQMECKEVKNEEVACTLQDGRKTRSVASQAVLVETRADLGQFTGFAVAAYIKP